MPRYHFHTQVGPDTIHDAEGEVLPDADAARRVAWALVLQLLESGGHDLRGAALRVTDGAGAIVLALPFAEVPGDALEGRDP